MSQYEVGKLVPSPEILSKLWALADATEKHLLMAHMSELLGAFSPEEQHDLSVRILGKTPLREALVNDLGEILKHPEEPEFLAEIVSLYRQFGGSNDQARKLFDQAAGWLRLQLEMQQSAGLEAPPHKRKRENPDQRT